MTCWIRFVRWGDGLKSLQGSWWDCLACAAHVVSGGYALRKEETSMG
jgi:hypothetical protein